MQFSYIRVRCNTTQGRTENWLVPDTVIIIYSDRSSFCFRAGLSQSRDWAWFKLTQPIVDCWRTSLSQRPRRFSGQALLCRISVRSSSRYSYHTWLLLSNKRPFVPYTTFCMCPPQLIAPFLFCVILYFSITRKAHGPQTVNSVSSQLCCITHTPTQANSR